MLAGADTPINLYEFWHVPADPLRPLVTVRARRRMRASRNAPREAGVDHIASNDYAVTLVDLKRRIRAAQQRALRSVNAELVQLYWQIGELIHQRQAAAGWGRSVVQRLAADLQKEFPGRSGFSATNLWLMKRLYEAYYRAPKLQMLSGVLGWSQNVAILTRCQGDLEREFYLRATARFGWSHAVLRHQLDTHAYHRFLNNRPTSTARCPSRRVAKPNWR